MRHALLLAFVPTLVPAQDPPAPPGGFPIAALQDRDLTWSDGYRTRVDVYSPRVTPPPSGWPGVFVAHGGGGSRRTGTVVQYCVRLARAGFCTFAFDIRGDGETPVLNPGGGDLSADRQVLDDAESWGLVAAIVPGRLDLQRLCVTGKSQGGRHSYWAAAWSEQPLPRQGFVTMGPRIAAVSPHITSLALLDAMVPGGLLVSVEEALRFYAQPPASPPRQMVLAQQFAQLRAYLGNQPTYDFLPLLRSSRVPLCVQMGWDDYKHQLEYTTDVLPTLPATTPKKLLLSTFGHGTPSTASENDWHIDVVRAWFERFAKGIQNGADRDPYCEVALTPHDPARYTSPTSAWPHRLQASWPPPSSPTTLWLRGDGTLSPNAPTSAEAGPVLRHRVQPGYGMDAFLRDGNVAAAVFASIPLASFAFDAAPAMAPLELRGRITVDVEVDASTGEFQLQAALLDLPPAGAPRFVTSGLAARRGGAAGRHALHIELNDVGYVLPAGHRARVALENVNWFRPPGQDIFRFAPYFTDVDIAVRIDPSAPPRVVLPVVPLEASLTPRFASVSVQNGLDHTLAIEAEPFRAGALYAILLGGSGIGSGTPLLGRTLWLVPDAWTDFGIQLVGTPSFAGFAGVLGGNGTATARLLVPASLAQTALGARLTMAGLGLAGAEWFALGTAQIELVP